MIALRGLVEKRSKDGGDSCWEWTGNWAFQYMPSPDNPQLPFHYTWQQKVNPDQVIVPSSEDLDEQRHDNNPEQDHQTKRLAEEATAPPPRGAQKESDSKETSTTDHAHKTDTAQETEISAENDKQKEASSKLEEKDKPAAAEGTHDSKNQAEENGVTQIKQNESKAFTFADKASPDDPDFTDASTVHPNSCPASGLWKGWFETLPTRKGAHNNVKVHESCYIFFNATPPNDTHTTFYDEDETDENQSKLLPGQIHVRGMGENQYGTFELVGSLDVHSGKLQCQRMYVRTPTTTTTASPRSASTSRPRGRPRSSGGRGAGGAGGGAGAGGSGLTDSDDRPHVTRKRQMSWKRRAAYEGVDPRVEEGVEASKMTRRHLPGMGRPGRPRGRSESSVTPSSHAQLPGSCGSLKPVVGLTISVPSPDLATANAAVRSELSGSGIGKKRHATTTAVTASTTAAVGHSSTGGVTLPADGHPKKARWRAAHFLYYDRNVTPKEEGNGNNEAPATSTSTTNAPATLAPTTTTAAAPAAAPAIPKSVIYEGEMLHGHREGRGVCLYNNGLLYEGEWRANREHGYGVLMSPDRKRIIYQGEWERGKMHGRGMYFYGDGQSKGQGKSRYEGEFKEGLRHGVGTYVLPDGSVYNGVWSSGVMSGRGVFTWPDGSVYDGEFRNGKRHGLGLLKVSDGFTYDGCWVNNTMEGRGSATYPSGQQYNGLFSNGRREGRGTILFTNGAVYEGRFRDDAVDGQGTMKMSRAMVVPRERNETSEDDDDGEKKEDFMIPVFFQSDIGHIHRKAGFTLVGE